MMKGMDQEAEGRIEDRSAWWLWRMSDRTLLPIRTDEEGNDWPCLDDARSRALVVDELLRSGAPVREERPNVAPGVLGAVSIGWWPLIAFVGCLVMAYGPGMPDAVRLIGGLGWLLIPAGVAAWVGYRRVRSLPGDLQAVAREEVRDASTRIRVRPWVAWTALVVTMLLGLSVIAVARFG